MAIDDTLRTSLMRAIGQTWSMNPWLLELVKAKHPFEDTEQSVHAKMNLSTALNIANRVILRQERQPTHKKDDFFGDGTKTTKLKLIKHIAILCSSENGWHDGAVCSHILASIGSRWYRQMLDWMIIN